MTEGLFARNVPGMRRVLQQACVGIAGCGGLGSNAAVALARAGIGHLILADSDRVELSNLNRQYFFQGDIGRNKTEALSEHLKAIDPDIRLDVHIREISPENVAKLFGKADILIEAFDRADGKMWLIRSWCMAFPDRPIISGNGVAGLGRTNELGVTRTGNIIFCGDMESDLDLGLCSARVAIVANMQANVAIELLMS